MKKALTLSITIFVSIFLITTLVTAGDVVLTNDGKVPGKPFQDLQMQIDELREQMQNSTFKGYFTADGDISLYQENQFVDVLVLNLPEGSYVSNMTLSVSSLPKRAYYLDCKFKNDLTGVDLTGLFGVSFAHPQQLAHTWGFNLFEDSSVVLTCLHYHESVTPYVSKSIIHRAEWTVVKVDELDWQPSP